MQWRLKTRQKYRYWYRQYFQCKVLVSLLAILFATIVNMPGDKIRLSVFLPWATRRKNGREGQERKGKVHKVTRCYISPTCISGVDTHMPIPIKFGMRVPPPTRNVINVSNFCNKIFRVSDLQGVKIPVFPLTLLVIVTMLRAQPVITPTISKAPYNMLESLQGAGCLDNSDLVNEVEMRL